MNDDNTRKVMRSEETVVAGQPEQTTVSQTETSMGAATTPVASNQSTVQTTTASTTPSDRVVSHNVAERVVDPAADKAASVDWINRLIWFIVGLMVALIAIRFVLLATGANETAGLAQLVYGVTGWMVAPFATLFGGFTYPGAEQTAVFEPASLVAIVVYVLLGFVLTRVANLMLGTNRTTGTVYSETDRNTKL